MAWAVATSRASSLLRSSRGLPNKPTTWPSARVDVRARAQGPGGQDDQIADETVMRVAQGLGAIGLSGSVAVAGAALAGVNLWGQFHWDRLGDFELAAASIAPLVALEAFLFLPPWGKGLVDPDKDPKDGDVYSPRTRKALALDAQPSLEGLQPALFMYMVAYSGSQKLVRGAALPPALGLGLLAGRELAKELFQRGLLMYGLASFLSDRVFESGSEQIASVALIGSLLGSDPGSSASAVYSAGESVRLACRYLAATLVTLVLLPPARVEAELLGLGVASSLTAINARAEGVDPQDVGSSGGSRGSSPGASAPTAAATVAGGAEAEAVPAAEAAAATATAAKPGSTKTGKLLMEFRMMEMFTKAQDNWIVQAAYTLTTMRSLLRLTAINAAFAATGNLAATFTLSVASNALLALYAEMLRASSDEGVEIMRAKVKERSGAGKE